MTVNEEINECLAAFEAWFSANEPSEHVKQILESGFGGRRWDADKETQWTAWQAAWNTRATPPIESELVASHPVFAFLLGEGQLDGRGFGDEPPMNALGIKRPYWWRKHLRAALALQCKEASNG